MMTPASLTLASGRHGFPGDTEDTPSGDLADHAQAALGRARDLFIAGNRIAERWRGLRRFSIFDSGFGPGLNFLATWQLWRADPERSQQLHYLALEPHPFRAADLDHLHQYLPEVADLAQDLRAAWPPLVGGFHRMALDQGRVILTLVFGALDDSLAEVDAGAGFDTFYLDVRTSSANPDPWTPAMLARLGRLAAPQARAASSSAAAPVHEGLTQAGFVCEPPTGGNPDKLCATFAPRWSLPSRVEPVRSAIVIGAGVAGCSISERLCARGWQVTLIERHAQPGQEISGNRAGIVMPLLSQDDNLSSRLARAAYLFAVQTWARVGGIGRAFEGDDCGVLQVASSADDAAAQRKAMDHFVGASEFVEWLDAQQIAARFGLGAEHGGWLFAQGGWATPASLCEALLAACGRYLERRLSTNAVRLARSGEDWQVLDADGGVIAAAPHVILANGNGAAALAQAQGLPLAQVRGQVTHLDAASAPILPLVVCGDAYMTPPAGDTVCVGATYDFDSDPELREDSQRENLEALQRTLPQLVSATEDGGLHWAGTGDGDASGAGFSANALSGRPLTGRPLSGRALSGRVGFRCVSPDRVPLAGALPDMDTPIAGSRLRDVARHPNLHGLLGYGSRGLIWAPFCAELVAAMLEGEPLPLERELAAALDPARFALKIHRRSSGT